MLRLILVLCVCGWFFTSCSSSESKSKEATVAGVYVREYSHEILNQLSGNKVGMRTIRDTLYIRETDTGYRVVNAKWRMNDYDEDGWQNMEHGESGPLPPRLMPAMIKIPEHFLRTLDWLQTSR
jgi:hypothetical protein